MKNRKFIKVIVVDAKSGQPMSWGGDQFLFVPMIKLTSERQSGFKVKTYQRQDALQLIKSDHQFRRANNLTETEFMLCLAEHGKC